MWVFRVLQEIVALTKNQRTKKLKCPKKIWTNITSQNGIFTITNAKIKLLLKSIIILNTNHSALFVMKNFQMLWLYCNIKQNSTSAKGHTKHMTHDMWHVIRDIWHVAGGRRWTFSENISSLALTVWEWRCSEDNSIKDDWLTQLINEWQRCL